jgi:hypothetical protein
MQEEKYGDPRIVSQVSSGKMEEYAMILHFEDK